MIEAQGIIPDHLVQDGQGTDQNSKIGDTIGRQVPLGLGPQVEIGINLTAEEMTHKPDNLAFSVENLVMFGAAAGII